MCRDRLTLINEVAALIPEIIETDTTRVGLLPTERQKIAEILLDKCVIITKENIKDATQ